MSQITTSPIRLTSDVIAKVAWALGSRLRSKPTPLFSESYGQPRRKAPIYSWDRPGVSDRTSLNANRRAREAVRQLVDLSGVRA